MGIKKDRIQDTSQIKPLLGIHRRSTYNENLLGKFDVFVVIGNKTYFAFTHMTTSTWIASPFVIEEPDLLINQPTKSKMELILQTFDDTISKMQNAQKPQEDQIIIMQTQRLNVLQMIKTQQNPQQFKPFLEEKLLVKKEREYLNDYLNHQGGSKTRHGDVVTRRGHNATQHKPMHILLQILTTGKSQKNKMNNKNVKKRM
jgi:hypothetical protein